MATAPKMAPKAVTKAPAKGASAPASKADEEEEVAVPKKSKKKLFVILGIVAVLLGGGGAAALAFMNKHGAHKGEEAEKVDTRPPVFVVMEPFTVNLQHETADQYLQVALTLQVGDQEQVEQIKLYMPQIRSRILLLLSSKKPSEISTAEGKKKLADEIATQIKLPVVSKGKATVVNDVFFTSFVIQ
jgi:flagellar protein FliL